MKNAEDIALMAHLMRRAGFGASRSEIEALAEKGYEETVEWLLTPRSSRTSTSTSSTATCQWSRRPSRYTTASFTGSTG